MSDHPTNFQGSIPDAVRTAILEKIPDAQVQVEGGGGHYSIEVVSPIFAGKGRLESQRLVLGLIKHLMAGDLAPVHAVDSLKTQVGAEIAPAALSVALNGTRQLCGWALYSDGSRELVSGTGCS